VQYQTAVLQHEHSCAPSLMLYTKLRASAGAADALHRTPARNLRVDQGDQVVHPRLQTTTVSATRCLLHMLSGAAQKLAVHARSGGELCPAHLRTHKLLSSQAVRHAQRAPSLCPAPGPEHALSTSDCCADRQLPLASPEFRLRRAPDALASSSGSRYLSQSYPPGAGYAAELSSPSCSSRRRGSSGQRPPTPSSLDAPCAARRLRGAPGCARRRGPTDRALQDSPVPRLLPDART